MKLKQKVFDDFKKFVSEDGKPCLKLGYCPYGQLVEQFPSIPPLRDEAVKHNNFLKEGLERGRYSGWRKTFFAQEVKKFDPDDYPAKIIDDENRACDLFGHYCPVFYVAEPFTEKTTPDDVFNICE